MPSMPKTKRTGKAGWFKELRAPVVKSLFPIGQELEDAIAQLPKWARNIVELMGASMERAYNIKEDSESAKVTAISIMCGHFAAFEKIKIKPAIKRKGVSPQMEKALKELPGILTPFQENFGKLGKKIYRVMLKQSPEVVIPFLNGYHRALEKKIYSINEPVFWETTATRIYIVLLMLIPVMPKINSVSHLHKLLILILGESVIGRVNDSKQSKRLGKLCERIELKFPRGRPKAEVKAPPISPTVSSKS